VKPNNNKLRTIAFRWLRRLAIIGIVLGCLWLLWWWNDPSRRLFFSASDVHEWHSPVEGWTGDGVRVFRARCSEEVFHRFARSEELTKRIITQDDAAGLLRWSSCPEPWWTPPQSTVGAYYFRREGGEQRLLGYADGYLYYNFVFW
jgi:hypothetical protein